MLKTRTWIRLGTGLVLLLLAVFIAILAWPKAPPSAESIAKRGLEAPAKGSSVWNGSFGPAQDWFDQGFDTLASWNGNPFGIRKGYFGRHLTDLKRSKDPKDQEEYRRLLELAKQWQENLLSRYPELRVPYRNVPDDRNALKLLSEFKKRSFNENGGSLFHPPDSFREQLTNKKPWDPKAAQAWLDANRAAMDELRRICLMPESSVKDLDIDAYGLWDYQRALLLDARLAAERGELSASLESIRASVAMANHLQGAEAPDLSNTLIAGYMLEFTNAWVFNEILPNIPASQLDLAAWETVINPTIQTPADFARTMRGEWNNMMSNLILPSLADPAENHGPADADVFVEAYTNYCSEVFAANVPLHLGDLPSHPNPSFDSSGLSWRSRQLTEGMQRPLRIEWAQQQIKIGLAQAAFDILQGKPVPNDPIYGRPYQWNPQTRQLSMPAGPEFSNRNKASLTLPKL